MKKIEELEKELDALLDEVEKINILIYQEKQKVEKLQMELDI